MQMGLYSCFFKSLSIIARWLDVPHDSVKKST